MGIEALARPVPREHRELVREMLGRLPEFADRLARLLSEEDEFYRQVEHVAPDELRQVCHANLERALTALAEGRGLALDAARKTGLVQARQGIPLPAVLRAFRIGGTFVYEALLELAGPEFLNSTRTIEINSYVWKAIDLYSDALTTAYDQVAAEPSHANVQRLDDLLRGRLAGQPEMEAAARELGLPTAGMFVAVVTERVERDGQDTVEALMRARRWRSAWRPGGEAGLVAIDRIEDLRRLREVLGSLPVAAGLSRPFAGFPDVPDALHRARIARRSLPSATAGVVVFGDSPVTTLVAAAPGMARDVVRSALSGVLTLPGAERKVLLDTLLAWFTGHGSAKEAADRLFVHPNTVRYRLRRVQDLTKRDLTDPVDIGELYVALESVRLDPEPS
ncbi:PucR family transcriptional regulator [Amycolatopsis sp. NPDC088138]|uniref:PucR family transcriptional regulator n=1 Tax=Amycolatopsis sp. NPDC088138 TaxID=3363938 RepID=UPI0037F46C2E